MDERALVVIDSCGASGLATQARLLVERLKGRGFEPHVAVLSGAGGPPVAAAASTHDLGRRHAIDPLCGWNLRRLVGSLRPAVVHAWGPDATRHAGHIRGRKLVATLGDRPSRANLLGLRLPGTRTPDLVVTASEAVNSNATAKTQLIAPGVDIAETDEDRSSARQSVVEELNLPPDARVIVVAGTMRPNREVKELIWCGDLVRVMRDNVRLLVVGDGPELPALARFARMASTPEHIRLLGPRDDVRRLLWAADVFWHAGSRPSIALLEAMAAGVPVVADDTPAARGVITPGENGLLTPPRGRAERGRATDALLADPALAERLATAARATIADKFNADRMADDYAAAYRELLD